VVERRSYDAFGKRRSPVWGQASPASFSSKTTKGFTGHEGDELGLVNMKGRIFDPKLGRFLTTDPIVSNLYFGQSLNAYSYVLNNPLSYVDPSGFEPEKPPILPIREEQWIDESGGLHVNLIYPPREGASPADHAPSEAAQVGAAAPPTDVDTTGSSSGYDPQPVTTAPEDWTQHSLVQVEGGFIGGLALGFVPFGSVIAGALSGPGSRWAEIGKGVGEIFGGGLAFTVGMAGMLGGGAASGTGVLTLPGVLVAVGSAALVAGGVANVKTGAERLGQALSMSSGSGSSGPQGTAPASNAVAGYRETFFRAHPQLRGQVVVHHAIEQQVLKRYPGLFTEGEIHALSNLRGIPKGANPDLHLSQIRRAWNDFYRVNPSATKQQILDFAANLDTKFGSVFLPPR
jgi:RHS repeat-associated protein